MVESIYWFFTQTGSNPIKNEENISPLRAFFNVQLAAPVRFEDDPLV
jgi:hypothetical protein